jgi:hypothetical protein
MPEPLEYRNAKAPEPVAPVLPAHPRAAIPIEFDTVVARTSDLAAARAIEDQLTREAVEVFRAEDGDPAEQAVVLLVRGGDFEHASKVAKTIFARRSKLRGFPCQK